MKTWTDEELRILTNNYSKICMEEMKKLLPNKTPLAIYKRAYKLGIRQTKEIEFLNRSNARKGEKGSNWKGGISISSEGYRFVKKPEHERANKRGYVLEHILIYEKEHGVKVPPGYCIHHLNGNKQDNRIENLCLMSNSEHTKLHHIGAKRTAETKRKLAQKSKERFKDPKNHPVYKEVDISVIKRMRENGSTIKEICRMLKISRSTYYKKMEGKV